MLIEQDIKRINSTKGVPNYYFTLIICMYCKLGAAMPSRLRLEIPP